MSCDNAVVGELNSSTFFDVENVIDSLLKPINGEQSISIDLNTMLVEENSNVHMSGNTYIQRKDFFLDEVLNDISTFCDIEKHVTKMFIDGIVKSNKYLIKEHYIQTFFPQEWTLLCFKDNSPDLKPVYHILNQCFLLPPELRIVYVHKCSLVRFAMLSFPYVLQSGLDKFLLKKINQERAIELQTLCNNPAINDEIKQFFGECNNAKNIRSNTANVGGGYINRDNVSNTWTIHNDQDIKNMFNLPSDVKIKTCTFTNKQGNPLPIKDVNDTFDFEVFNTESDFEKQLNVNKLVKDCFDDTHSLDYYTLLAVYPHASGSFIDSTEMQVKYLPNNLTTGQVEEVTTQRYQNMNLVQLQTERYRLLENITTIKQRIVLTKNIERKTELTSKLIIAVKHLETVDKLYKVQNNNKRRKKKVIKTQKNNDMEGTLEANLKVIPSKHYSGDLSNITLLTFEEIKEMFESVIIFLEHINVKDYQQLNVTPKTIVYENYSSGKAFYLGDYKSITKKDVVGLTDPFYTHPSVFTKICSDEKNECITQLKHVFTTMINYIYKSDINSKDMAYRLDKVFYLCKRCLENYEDNTLQQDSSLYSIGVVLLEILLSHSKFSKKEFDVMLFLSQTCLLTSIDHEHLLDILKDINSNSEIEDEYTPMDRYKFMTNSNTNKHTSKGVCFRNDNNITHIYYVRTPNQPSLTTNNTNDKIKLTEIVVNGRPTDEYISFFKTLSCQQNVLVYGSSFDRIQDANISNVVKFLQEVCNALPKNKKFVNVTIINECSNTKNPVYNVYNDNNQLICKKIINAVTDSFFKDPATGQYLDVKHYHVVKDNTGKDYTYRGFFKTAVVKNVRLKNASNDAKTNSYYDTNKIQQVEETWWFKMYFDSPYCAFGRFVQFSGTCWFNAVINSLILIPSIAVILTYMYGHWAKGLSPEELKNFQDSASFQSCPANMTLKQMLYTIVYLVFIKGERAIRSDNSNFIAHYASLLLSSSKFGSTEHYQKIINKQGITKASEFSDGYHGFKAIEELFQQVFPPEIATYLKVKTYHDTELQTDNLKENVLPYLVAIETTYAPSVTLNKKITINNSTYVLQSCCLIISDKQSSTHSFHAVAGLTCNGKDYIYNSWNDTVPTNWTEHDISNFLRYTNQKYIGKNYKFERFDYLVYVREDIKNLFEAKFKELGEEDEE